MSTRKKSVEPKETIRFGIDEFGKPMGPRVDGQNQSSTYVDSSAKPRKPGRNLDCAQTNRRQKHELAHRAKRWRCSKLAVILVDMLDHYTGVAPEVGWLEFAKSQLRRANREARRK